MPVTSSISINTILVIYYSVSRRVKTEPLDTVEPRKLAYYGHTMRKQGSCLKKEIMQGTMSGASRRRRPWWTTSRRGQDFSWKSQWEWQQTEINGVRGVANPWIRTEEQNITTQLRNRTLMLRFILYLQNNSITTVLYRAEIAWKLKNKAHTRWLRSDTPDCLKSGNLMFVASGENCTASMQTEGHEQYCNWLITQLKHFKRGLRLQRERNQFSAENIHCVSKKLHP